MSKKKTAVRLSPVKVILPIFALVILFVVVLAIINCSTKAKTYECTKFEQVVSTTSGEITDKKKRWEKRTRTSCMGTVIRE